uniref:Uncharacterized protein n=1 Tax=Tanacetum cinerariifolium TaxID=118510 RepID=A0A6L2J3T2_TANCI|nr:hypothetical protein [Tanacetum cinerariifolium]
MSIDEQIESESMDVVSTISSSDVKIVESKVESVNIIKKGVCSTIKTKPVKKNSFSPPIIDDWIFDDESEVEFEPKVEGRFDRIKRLLSVIEVTAAGYGFYCWEGLLGLKDFLVLLKLLLLAMVSTAAKVNAASEYGYNCKLILIEDKLRVGD